MAISQAVATLASAEVNNLSTGQHHEAAGFLRLRGPREFNRARLFEFVADTQLETPLREPLPIQLRDICSPTYWGEKLRYALSPSYQKRTGLETLDNAALHQLTREKGAFERARTEAKLLVANWERPFKDYLLKHPQRRALTQLLRQTLVDQPLLELGVGEHAVSHRQIFRKALGIRSYRAVDQQEQFASHQVKADDLLGYLSSQPAESGHVVAFGVFNEPLSPALGGGSGEFFFPAKNSAQSKRMHAEHEYLRRLAKELYRVVPKGGLLFGMGLHAVGTRSDVEIELLKVGFMHERSAYELVERSDPAGKALYDPFFLRKR